MNATRQMTPNNALMWLAARLPELRVECRLCHGTGQHDTVYCYSCTLHGTSHPNCRNGGCNMCFGCGWLPNSSVVALHDAMHNLGWDVFVSWKADGCRAVQFCKAMIGVSDVNDWVAATTAIQSIDNPQKV